MQVTITYSPDPTKVGTTVDVPDDEAKRLIDEGRAVRAGIGQDPVAAEVEAGGPAARAVRRVGGGGAGATRSGDAEPTA